MSDQSNHLFGHRRGPVFMADGPAPTGSTPPSPSLSSANDSMSQYEGMFQKNMSDQMELYGKTNELNQQKNTMQSIMDVGMKAGKAVQT